MSDVDDVIKSPAYAAAVSIYSGIAENDSAYLYSMKLMSVGTLSAKETALKYMIDYYSVRGDLNKVCKCLAKYKEVADSIKTTNASEAILKMNSLYNYGLREKENEKLRQDVKIRTYVYALMVLSFVLVIVFILYNRERSRKKLQKVMYMNEHLEQLYRASCIEHDVSLKQKETEIAVLRNKLEKLDCSSIEEKDKMRVYEILRSKIKNNKMISENAWSEIKELTDRAYPTFRQKLIGKFGLDDEEYKISILVKFGLLNIEIATIMCKSPSAITQKRASMYKKIFKENGNSKDYNAFIKSL